MLSQLCSKGVRGRKGDHLIIFSYKYEVNLFQILNLDNTKLCPSSQKFGREEWLTIFCVLLALANMVLFTNLLYDYYQYYVNGKLPKIIKWIPYLQKLDVSSKYNMSTFISHHLISWLFARGQSEQRFEWHKIISLWPHTNIINGAATNNTTAEIVAKSRVIIT